MTLQFAVMLKCSHKGEIMKRKRNLLKFSIDIYGLFTGKFGDAVDGVPTDFLDRKHDLVLIRS